MKQTIEFPLALGDQVKDRVTGYTGIVIALTIWFNKCMRATVQRSVDDKGAVPPAEGFDVEQLELTGVRVDQKSAEGTGGPMPAVTRL